MDPIPAMPVSPAPVADAANNARDAKACDNADSRGFGNQLKQEIAARSGDASEAPAEAATAAADAPVDEKTEDAALAEAKVSLDPAVAALLADAAAVQQPVAAP